MRGKGRPSVKTRCKAAEVWADIIATIEGYISSDIEMPGVLAVFGKALSAAMERVDISPDLAFEQIVSNGPHRQAYLMAIISLQDDIDNNIKNIKREIDAKDQDTLTKKKQRLAVGLVFEMAVELAKDDIGAWGRRGKAVQRALVKMTASEADLLGVKPNHYREDAETTLTNLFNRGCKFLNVPPELVRSDALLLIHALGLLPSRNDHQ